MPGNKPGLWSIVHYHSHLRIMDGAKRLLELDDLDTDDLLDSQAIYTGQLFEDGFAKVDAALKVSAKQERESRRKS